MKKRVKYKHNLKTIIAFVIAIVIISIMFVYNKMFNFNKTYTVVNGSVEKISDTYLYVIKDETLVDVDDNTVSIPVIKQNSRASKNEIISVYKNENYDLYQEKISALDKEIDVLVKDLPTVYSSDISMIDEQISNLMKKAQEENSYIKIQEYKNNINSLLNKKMNILVSLSPAGSKIRELIVQREELEKSSKQSSHNIKAPLSGIVSYKIDGLENIYDFNKILTYDATKLDEIINKYTHNDINNFGIKIIDNYNCYFLTKDLEDENLEYVKEGKLYQINLMDKNSNQNNIAVLQKSIKKDGYVYNIFSIGNMVEDIIDSREVAAKIIWTRKEGLVVPLESIETVNEIDYVTLVTGGEYIKVPIKKIISNDTICVVENYTSEELESLGIEVKGKLELYDNLLINENNQ